MKETLLIIKEMKKNCEIKEIKRIELKNVEEQSIFQSKYEVEISIRENNKNISYYFKDYEIFLITENDLINRNLLHIILRKKENENKN